MSDAINLSSTFFAAVEKKGLAHSYISYYGELKALMCDKLFRDSNNTNIKFDVS